MIVGSDSHTTTYGALGAFSAGIGRSEVAAIWATGELWFQVHETIKIILKGLIPRYITPKDIALYIIGQIKSDGADYKAVEFNGKTIAYEAPVKSPFLLPIVTLKDEWDAGTLKFTWAHHCLWQLLL